MEKFIIKIGSTLEDENFYADIYTKKGKVSVAGIYYIGDEMKVRILCGQLPQDLEFDLDELIGVLEKAKKKLAEFNSQTSSQI